MANGSHRRLLASVAIAQHAGWLAKETGNEVKWAGQRRSKQLSLGK
jgi:hypothetical protein